MEGTLVEFGGVTGVVLVVMQFAKQYIPEKFRPLAAVILGIVLSNAYGLSQGKDVASASIEGIIAGLTASGLYDQKAVVTK